jgi:hypothetical protein
MTILNALPFEPPPARSQSSEEKNRRSYLVDQRMEDFFPFVFCCRE